MNTSLKHLSIFHQQQLGLARKIIIDAIQPEKIILFGVFSAGREAALFTEKLPAGLLAYDLLVVSRAEDQRSDYELQDIVENRCRDRVPATMLVHNLEYVNKKIAEGHYFFNEVCMEGICLYSRGWRRLETPCQPNWKLVKAMAEQDYDRWARQAQAFFNSALFNQREKEWKLAVFMLHQAAEHIYQAILLVFTGYKPTTHNLDKLRRYTNRFSLDLTMLFSRNTMEEDYLFRLLVDGYVEARYNDRFRITEQEVRTLIGRVGQLLEIAQRICRNRFLSLEKKASQQ